MKIEEFRKLLGRITYKPNWSIRFGAEPWGDSISGWGVLRLFHEEPDAGQPWRKTDAVNQSEIDQRDLESWDEARALLFVRDQIKSAEDHEFREFFQVDGKQMYDPHPEIRMAEKYRKAQQLTPAQAGERYGRP